MPVLLCPRCRKAIAAAAIPKGSKVKCSHCGAVFVVRAKGATKADLSRAKRSRILRNLKWSLATGAALLIAISISMGWRNISPRSDIQLTPANQIDPPKQPIKQVEVTKLDDLLKPKVIPLPMSVEEQITHLTAKLNEMRKFAKLAPLNVDVDLSRGCQAHADYVAANREHPKLATAAGLKEEDPSLSGYGDDGKQAAKVSLVAFTEPNRAVAQWIGGIGGRLSLLHPDLEHIGLGAAMSARGEWITVLDATRGHGVHPVAFPAANQTNVPLNFSGGPEAEAAAGFPVSLQFPPDQSFVVVDASLTDDLGNRVPVLLSTPAQPLPGVRRPGLVGLIPRQPLSGKSTYNVRVACQWRERPLVRQWQFSTEDDGDADGLWGAKMLERINSVRRHANLSTVQFDDVLSHGCRLHARYLRLNARRPEVQGMGAHEEDAKLPGYTAEGAKAGRASDIAFGDFEPIGALDGWMATLYHRVPILEPNLRKVGFGCIRGQGLGWITVLDVFTDRDKKTATRPVVWPVDGQADVPLHFPPGGETPNPIPNDETGRAGYPITAFFPREAPLLGAQAKLEDVQGQQVACWFSSPEAPANPKFERFQGTTVCLIPKVPLRPVQSYRVTMSGTIAGAAWKKTWTFSTAKAGPTESDSVQLVAQRIDQIRHTAGLPAVRLDPDLSKKCQAEADDLVRQRQSETPKGLTVSSNSVYLRAPSPTTQIEDLIGTLQRRSSLLDRRLRRIGLGCAHEEGRGWINVLDLHTGCEEGEPVIFPSDGQSRVPIQGHANSERTSAVGFPITVRFPGQTVTIHNARATLADSTGAVVDILMSTPDAPFEAGVPQPNVLGIHPVRALRPGQGYAIGIVADINGAEWRYNGRFSTAAE